jgi:predicted GNAT family acetyltransferase
MIRPLVAADRESLRALLAVAPELNLYLLGNLEASGFDQEFCEFWGDEVEGELRAVVNRYMTGWTVYGRSDADWDGLGAVVDDHAVTAERLQDNAGGVSSFLPYLHRYCASNESEETLMELVPMAFSFQAPPPGLSVRRATLDDFAGLVKLYANAANMSRTPAGVERPLLDRRVWIAESNNEIVAAALTNAETDTLAMIGGVYTVPAWRGRGLSQAVCSGLCEELICTGRKPILYWDNDAAGRVYRKLGFRRIGTWRSVRLRLV